jgi:hypothetical protein
MIRTFGLLAAALLLVACEAKIGNDDEGQANRAAEPGKVSLEAPGIDVKVDIPSVEKFAKVEAQGGSDLLYPGSQLAALHVNAREKGGRVDLRFSSRDSLDLVSAWYRDPGRAGEFTIDSTSRDGSAQLLRGRETDGNGTFELRLEPASDGGTSGRLTLSES